MIGYVQDWFLNLVVILIIIMLIELLTPQNTYSKYIRFVTGLLLMIFIITPIFHLLSADFNQWVDDTLQFTAENVTGESKKSEIETSIQAYTLEQAGELLKNKVEEDVVLHEDISIQSIQFETEDQTITSILVELDEPISAEVTTGRRIRSESELIVALARKWEVPESMIQIMEVGGVE